MSTMPFSPEQSMENTDMPANSQQNTVAEQVNHNCQPAEKDQFNLQENGILTSASSNSDYFGVSPDKHFELPGADSFKSAIEKLRLPEIIQGKPFECVVRLFTLNNGFDKKIQIDSVDCFNRNDFCAELNDKKTLLHLKGFPVSEGEIPIRFRYTTMSAASRLRLFSSTAQNEYIKKMHVSPAPILEWNKFFKKALQAREFSPKPRDGQAGKLYEENLNLQPDAALQKQITFLSAQIDPPDCRIKAEINSTGNVKITGTPIEEVDLSLNICYEYLFANKKIQEAVSIHPFAHIAPDEAYEYEKLFIQGCQNIVSKRSMAGTEATIEFSLKPLIDTRFLEITNLEIPDEHFSLMYESESMVIKAKGVPDSPGAISATIKYLVKTACGNVDRNISVPILTVTPDPKTLWKNLPTDPAAPYQAKDIDYQILKAGERVIVAASKRGRSHAHEGKFRDDNFKIEYISETGWSIVVVSDGAGSAKFSREGSKITCETFCEIMKAKLSSAEVNAKIDGMPEDERQKVLSNAVLSAAYQCLSKIDAESRTQNNLRKDYNATFLGYIMKRFGEQWLIISMGIGDGIIGLIDREDHLQLLSEPDGGEFVGQTRFITMNEVWNDNPINRVRIHKVSDFGIIISMSDGVSDPKFETDNNLKNEKIWLDLWNEIVSQVPLSERSEATAQKLCDWLDFWAKGNHDDRTIVLVY